MSVTYEEAEVNRLRLIWGVYAIFEARILTALTGIKGFDEERLTQYTCSYSFFCLIIQTPKSHEFNTDNLTSRYKTHCERQLPSYQPAQPVKRKQPANSQRSPRVTPVYPAPDSPS